MTKPFNLEEAKAGKPVQTRDGKPARIVCFDAKGELPIVALIDMGGREVALRRTLDGVVDIFRKVSNDLDLVMTPVAHIKWANLYRSTDGSGRVYVGGDTFDTKELAAQKGEKSPYYITSTKITWEE